MDDKRTPENDYRTKTRLLARKGSAEPLLRKQGTKPAAPLTALLDENLIGVVSPHSGQMGRNPPMAEDDER